MLERATSCLKAGARDSIKCAQHAKAQVPRSTTSRRRLHSTFWTHGAGDIDIDVNVLGNGGGADLLTRHDDIHHSGRTRGRRRGKEATSVTAVPGSHATPSNEPPFLDFLYPPHALALLQRSNGQPWERWERRNARRLPEGFVQASRGYSSRSHARLSDAKSKDDGVAEFLAEQEAVETNATEAVKKPGEEDPKDGAEWVRMEPIPDSAGTDEGYTIANAVNTHVTTSLVREITATTKPREAAIEVDVDEDEPSDALSAISPGDLSDAGARELDLEANPHEALRTMMIGRRRKYTAQDISRAWSLYNSLPESTRADHRLMHELLLWFSRIDLETAQAHSISLFWALPLEARTLQDYEAVLNAFLKRKTYDAVAGVHQEALRSISNGQQITKRLFEQAVNDGNWQLALQVKEDHDNAFKDDPAAESRQKALFWINVTEIPNLIEKAEALVHKCRWFKCRGRKDLDKFTAFSASLSEEAFRQKSLAPWDCTPSQTQENKKTRGLLVKLADSIREWSPNAPRLYEEFILKLLEQNRSEDQWRQVHNIVSYLYGHYRDMPDVHPPEHLFHSLLSRVLPYAIHLRKLQFSEKNVSVDIIVEDWQKHHGKLNCWAVKRLMEWYAKQGLPGPLNEYFAYLQRHYPVYKDQESVLWTLIYVHARRNESDQAMEAFDRVDKIAKSNGARPDAKCWNVLMHAHARGDDLVGGLDTYGRMVDVAKLLPDQHNTHPLLEMLARRGDADGVSDLLKQYDALTGEPHRTSFVGSRMRALINSGEVSEAEQRLKDAVQQVRDHELIGSLTGCFNILIAAYAQRRDLDATMRTYRWMKAEKIRLDRYTYTGLMLALIHFRQTSAAYTIMTKVMHKEGLIPTALHYAIVMAGLVKQQLYDRAIWVHEKMVRKNLRPSLATRRNYLKAVAMKEKLQRTAYTPDGDAAPLMQVVNELRDALMENDGSEVASKDPVFGHDSTAGGEDVSEHFVSVLFVHGKHRCFAAVHELFSMHQEEIVKSGKANAAVPMRILTAMMNTHLHSGDYEQVEAYWEIAKDNANRIAPSIAVPDYQTSSRAQLAAPVDSSSEQDKLLSAPAGELDGAEVGFEATRAVAVPDDQKVLPASLPRMAPRPSPGRRYILTRPLRYHLRALAAQNRIADVLTTFTGLVRQGYAFDIITWNRLIEHLCTATPPLALLAFTLTERYLIPNFPGWTPRYMTKKPARKSAVSEGLQYIRGRYLSYDALVPQYRTMVYLTAALLKLRRMEAMGTSKTKGEIGRYVGTVRQIEAVAPRTLDAVNSMPQIQHDKLQHQLLRSDEANQL